MSKDRLKVVIIGAGIAGLAAGVMLREFADITILESAAELKEIGAAVTLGPGPVTILRRFGIHLEREGGLVTEGFALWTHDGQMIVKAPHRAKERTGEDAISIHRADLHSTLHRVAISEDGPGTPCQILLEHKVTHLDAGAGIATLSDGTSFSGDVIIAADGVRSNARPFITDENVAPEPSGESAYRMLIRLEDLQAINHPLLENGQIPPILHQVRGPQRKLIAYPIRGGSVLNFIAFVPDSELHEPVSGERWTSKGSIESMIKSHEHFAPFWKDILSSGKEVGIWQMRDLLPLKTWVKGRAILIGDAAHPMLPHRAAGAMSAIEDAEALSVFLRNVTTGSPTSVHDALLQTYRVRYKRASMCQSASRAGGIDSKDKPDSGEEILRVWTYPGAEKWAAERPDMVLDA